MWAFPGLTLSFLPGSPHTTRQDLVGDSFSCLLGVICLGVANTRLPVFLATPVACTGARRGNTQPSPSAFKLSAYTPRPFGPRQSWVQILPLPRTCSMTLSKSLIRISFDCPICIMQIRISVPQNSYGDAGWEYKGPSSALGT